LSTAQGDEKYVLNPPGKDQVVRKMFRRQQSQRDDEAASVERILALNGIARPTWNGLITAFMTESNLPKTASSVKDVNEYRAPFGSRYV
jgi:hypothetical protein